MIFLWGGTISTPDAIPTVNADMVGSIISFEGSLEIRDANGRKVVDENIKHGDTVVLDAGSSLLLGITDSFTTKIVGPATFQVIQEQDDTYRIKLLDGDFVAVQKKLTDTSTTSWSQDTAQLSVETHDGVVVQTHDSQQSDFVVTKDEKNSPVIYNNSPSPVTVTKKDPITQEETTHNVLQRQKIVREADDSVVTSDIAQEEEYIITQLNPTDEGHLSSVPSVIETGIILTGTVISSWQITTPPQPLIVDGKIVFDDETEYLLQQHVLGVFLQKDVYDIALAYSQWHQRGVDIWLVNLSYKIKQAYDTIGIQTTVDTSSIVSIIPRITDLINVLETEYHTPPIVLKNLNTTKDRLTMIHDNIAFGDTPDIDNIDDLMIHYQQQKPSFSL